jgi:hypothetical protein
MKHDRSKHDEQDRDRGRAASKEPPSALRRFCFRHSVKLAFSGETRQDQTPGGGDGYSFSCEAVVVRGGGTNRPGVAVLQVYVLN